MNKSGGKKIAVFTIGFAKKTAKEFFGALQNAKVERIIDIRLRNDSQLAGFTKKENLEYFLDTIAGIGYRHVPELAPTKDIFDDYKKKKIDWEEYKRRFLKLLDDRNAAGMLSDEELDRACFLCSEPAADKCHRKLVAEYLQSKSGKIDIRHL